MCSHPFDSLQVPLQQTVQREGDDVVHVLELEEGETQESTGHVRGFQPEEGLDVILSQYYETILYQATGLHGQVAAEACLWV